MLAGMNLLAAVSRPTISSLWARTRHLPLGKPLFSRLIGRIAPYTGTMGASVLELDDGHCVTELRERHQVRNHLKSIHAVALINLGELTTGLAVMHAVDGHGRGIVKRLECEYLKKARGTITGTCQVDVPRSAGTHELLVEGVLRDEAGDVVARVTATWKLDLEPR